MDWILWISISDKYFMDIPVFFKKIRIVQTIKIMLLLLWNDKK